MPEIFQQKPQDGKGFTNCTKSPFWYSVQELCMGTIASSAVTDLSRKQQQILSYLRAHVDSQTYFKSRLIGEELDMSAKEVGTNMSALCNGNYGITIEKWGYSSGTTWKVTKH